MCANEHGALSSRASTNIRDNGLLRLPDGLTPHSLRRTFASLLFGLGEPPPYVMSQLGHTTAGFTLALYRTRDAPSRR